MASGLPTIVKSHSVQLSKYFQEVLKMNLNWLILDKHFQTDQERN